VKSSELSHQINQTPLVAILRGVPTDEVLAIAQALYQSGVRFIEIPFTSTNASDCISLLSDKMVDEDVYIGGGTVLTLAQLDQCIAAGGLYAVAPNVDEAIISYAKQANFPFIPGFWSPSEAIAAVQQGSRVLKFFPAHAANPTYIRSVRTVLPAAVAMMTTGSLSLTQAEEFLHQDCVLGLGSNIYQLGDGPAEVKAKAKPYIKLIAKIHG